MRSKINLRHRPILIRAVATLLAILVVSVIAWAAHQTAFTLALAAGGAALAGLLGAWAGRSVARRLGRAREISRAWLHGNLSLRIADPIHDDVGLLAAQLDLLAEHLEQDERDLAERLTN
jgi:methyl-accepting chemotaxis protein